MNCKVSIVTVCFNSAAFIEDAFLSVFSQTYDDIEYIVIDGGSADGTVDIIKKYADKIAYWCSEPDKGISDAFNKGLARCRGDIIGILNADDRYTPRAAETAVKVLTENPAAGFVFGDAQMCDLAGEPLFRWQGDAGYAFSITYDMPSIPHPTVFVRKAVYEEHGGFDTGYKTAMDYELLLRITLKGVRGIYIPAILAEMRLGGESDRNYKRAYREVLSISVRYGYPRLPAWGWFCYKLVKSFVRRKLQRIGLEAPVRMFRTYVGKRFKY